MEMEPGRFRCVNCGISLKRMKRHYVFEEDAQFLQLVAQWIAPREVTEDDYICNGCWDLATSVIRRRIQEAQVTPGSSQPVSGPSKPIAGPSQPQHNYRKVCVACGCSILRRRSQLVIRQNPTEQIALITTIIANAIRPRKVIATDQVCYPCFLRAQRSAKRMQQVDANRHIEQQPQIPERGSSSGSSSDHEDENVAQYEDENVAQYEDENVAQYEHQNVAQYEDQNVAQYEHQNVEEPNVAQYNLIHLPNYKRAPNTARHCVFPRCENASRRIYDIIRNAVLVEHHYYLPVNARICNEHLMDNNWEYLTNLPNVITTFTAAQIEDIFSLKDREAANPLNFNDIQSMPDHLVHYWLGISKDQFQHLLNEVPRIGQTHRGTCGLAALLVKFRNGDSNERLASLFQVPRSTLERLTSDIREILLQDFVPNNLGIAHITRENIINRNLLIPNGIYNAENEISPIVICDGTYIYLQKSTNYRFQKDTYSLHKYRNLVKQFLIVSCDGYIIDVLGPYPATRSDAEIMTEIFHEEDGAFRQYFHQGDIFILDRGFRDSIALLQECGYRAYMPETLEEGASQLTTPQANRSRCVTICRWVVEVVNGYFKRF